MCETVEYRASKNDIKYNTSTAQSLKIQITKNCVINFSTKSEEFMLNTLNFLALQSL